ncbi:MAG: glycosyltransferase family 2 protein [Lachnospiraceae bacterium]|nr:glycosyltransferase family 2 protein [Lachnospiraceae bacterium]
MNQPPVSIVMPVHNAEAVLEETVRSVLEQSFGDYELIMVEDNSSDGSLRLMRRLAEEDKRIRVLVNDGEHGAALARNLGIKAAAGRYLTYLDADDIWRKDKLKKTLRFMKERGASFVFTAYEFGDENAKGTGRVVHVPPVLDYAHALTRTIIFTSTVMLDLEKLGKKKVLMPPVPSEDTASWWRILRSGTDAYGLDENLVIYRRAGKSLSSNKMVAVKRIWYLYRKQARLSIPRSMLCMFGWGWRALARRI